MWVSDPNTNAPIASASLAQVTATPAMHTYQWPMSMPVLAVGVPGLEPVTIGCPAAWRFSPRRGVYQKVAPALCVSLADWHTLVEKFGLGPQFGRGQGLFGKLFRIYFVVALIVVVSLGLFGLGYQARDIYEYHVGAPTTATIDRCVPSGKSTTCYGTWSVGGRSQTGPIHGAGKSDRVGSSLDVHVSGGTAYAASTGHWSSYVGILVGALFMALFVFGAWRGFTSMFGGRSSRRKENRHD